MAWEAKWEGATGAYTESCRLSALAHHQLGDAATAREFASKELARAERFGAQWHIGSALSTQALVGPTDVSVETMRAAVEALGNSQFELRHADGLVELGAMLRRAGQDRESREPLEQGREIAARLSARAVEERALEELVAAGARPRVRSRDPEELTPSELRVAQRAAQGLTNREIAQELFVTQKTVETHLSNVYRKLEISSRAQLPERLETSTPASEPQPIAPTPGR
jgi:DNA-binding NarL/FixJ family response regulator